MKRLLPCRFLLLVAGLQISLPTASPADGVAGLVGGNTQFAVDVFRILGAEQSGNLFFSPYSVSVAMAMTYAGARGETETQMARALRLPDDGVAVHELYRRLGDDLASRAKDGVELASANALWPHVHYPPLPAFVDTVRANYASDVFPVDFGAGEQVRLDINGWVEDRTHDKIKDLIPPGTLNALTRLVLVNAVYFKADWKNPFRATATKPLPFHCADGRSIATPMMTGKQEAMYAEVDGLQVLDLPYRGNQLSMLLVLPGAADGLTTVQSSLDAGKLESWTRALHWSEVFVTMPVFKMTGTFRLNSVLSSLGMANAFDPGAADFSGITDREGLYISEVLHQAFVEVNEKGTEAAAATAVVMQRATAVRPNFQEFRADRPFLFFIRDRATGTILFAGRYAEPPAS